MLTITELKLFVNLLKLFEHKKRINILKSPIQMWHLHKMRYYLKLIKPFFYTVLNCCFLDADWNKQSFKTFQFSFQKSLNLTQIYRTQRNFKQKENVLNKKEG